MKKIGIVFSDLKQSSGVSNVAIEIANLLSTEKGYDVTLLPIYEWGASVRWRISNKVKVKRVFPFYFRGFSKVVKLISDRHLYQYLVGDNKYDLVIAFQYGRSTQLVANGAQPNQKRIGWMHCYDEGLLFRKEYIKLSKMICVSKCNSDRLFEDLNHQIPVDYCYNPIKDEQIIQQGKEIADLTFIKRQGPLLVSVGRHSPEKGYDRLIKIMHKLKGEGFDYTLLLLGDGPQHNELIALTKTLQLENNIYFLGSVRNPHKYTSKCDLFICSSFIEGYSTACTEALLLGVPVLSTDCAGGEEIVSESEVGKLTKMDDESLYKGIKEVLQTPDILRDWKEGLKNTKCRYTQKYRSEKLFSIIETALK